MFVYRFVTGQTGILTRHNKQQVSLLNNTERGQQRLKEY